MMIVNFIFKSLLDFLRLATIILLFVLSFQASYAFQKTVVFGEISIEELSMKVYDRDTSAVAVILYDRGDARVEPSFSAGTTLKIHRRIKILKKAALDGGDSWGDLWIPARRESFYNLRGSTYSLEDGKVVKTELDEKAVYKTKLSHEVEGVSIPFANVHVGTVIEYTYVISRNGLYLMPWRFQYDIPVACSEYVLKSPAWDRLYSLHGFLPLTKYETKEKNTLQFWKMCNIPAFRTEPFIPENSGVTSFISFSQPNSSWKQVYLQLKAKTQFKDPLEGNKYLNDIVDQMLVGIVDQDQKLKKILAWIKEHVTWNNETDIFSDDFALIIERRTGSSGDINLMLITMLKRAGFKAEPVILSTRSNGYLLEDDPRLTGFNYVVCRVTDQQKEILLDATEKYLPFDLLPPRCFNHKGFVVGDGYYAWIAIEPSVPAKNSFEARLSIDTINQLVGHIEIIRSGYAAFTERKRYKNVGESEYKKYLDQTDEMKDFMITKSGIDNLEEIDLPLNEHHDVIMDANVTRSSDLIYVNPFVFMRNEINPFTASERIFPVDFSELEDKVMVCSIAIPAGYFVDELPANKIFALKDNTARCVFSVSQSEKDVQVTVRLKINKTLFQPDEYPNLREFYARFVARKSENIVFRRRH